MGTTQDESKTGKWIVFTVADFPVALPLAQVLQVMNCPTITRELSKLSLVQIGRHVVRLLDLHQQLALEEAGSVPEDRPFLVVTHDGVGSLYAIPVSQPPTLMEFSPEMIRSLPQSCGQSKMLKSASYAAMVAESEFTSPVFLLDIKRVLLLAEQ